MDIIKEAYSFKFGRDLPLYEMDLKNLKPVETRKADVDNFVRRFPPEKNRVYTENFLKLEFPELKPDLERVLLNHPRERNLIRQKVDLLERHSTFVDKQLRTFIEATQEDMDFMEKELSKAEDKVKEMERTHANEVKELNRIARDVKFQLRVGVAKELDELGLGAADRNRVLEVFSKARKEQGMLDDELSVDHFYTLKDEGLNEDDLVALKDFAELLRDRRRDRAKLKQNLTDALKKHADELNPSLRKKLVAETMLEERKQEVDKALKDVV